MPSTPVAATAAVAPDTLMNCLRFIAFASMRDPPWSVTSDTSPGAPRSLRRVVLLPWKSGELVPPAPQTCQPQIAALRRPLYPAAEPAGAEPAATGLGAPPGGGEVMATRRGHAARAR